MQNIRKSAVISLAVLGTLLGGAGAASADATATGTATNSPGVLSGNLVQVPVHVPINICGDTVNVIGALNPAFGNTCVNGPDC